MAEVLITVFLGWLLGLLSNPIANRILRHYNRDDLRIAISSEFKEIIVQLALLSNIILQHLGNATKDDYVWMENILKKYYQGEDSAQVLSVLKKIIEVPENELSPLLQLFKQSGTKHLNLKLYDLPFLNSRMEDISVFDSQFQTKIFDIRSNIHILNQEIENAQYFTKLTFDPSCMNTNKDIIKNNIDNAYKNIYKRCRVIVGKMDNI